jgi:hypothetical protein
MPTNLLLLRLLGGFLFFHICYYTRFRAQRLENYRLVMESAAAGLVLFLCSRFVIVFLGSTHIGWLWLAGRWLTMVAESVAPFEYSGTASGAFLIGVFLAIAINCLVSKTKAKRRVMRRHGSAFYRLLNEAEIAKRPIAVTLDNRKWYAGHVAELPNLDPLEQYFRILPSLSGYRDDKSMKVTISVYYNLLAESGVDTSQYVITLPLAAVKIASFFDLNLYQTYFALDCQTGLSVEAPIEVKPIDSEPRPTENSFS